jgi:hypothetical protein
MKEKMILNSILDVGSLFAQAFAAKDGNNVVLSGAVETISQNLNYSQCHRSSSSISSSSNNEDKKPKTKKKKTDKKNKENKKHKKPPAEVDLTRVGS